MNGSSDPFKNRDTHYSKETRVLAEETVRIGIVGAGANTRGRHIPELQRLPGVEIVSVANRSRASSEHVAADFGIPTVYDHWEDLVSADDTDAIVIGTWPYLHHAVTLAALKAGKHVLCEARMAMNLQEASQMLHAAQARPDLITQLVPAPMSLGVDNTLIRLLQEGYIGDLLAVEARASGTSFADWDSPLHWRQNRALSGNNILTMGIWYETLLRWIGHATHVFAHGKTVVSERLDPTTGQLAPVSIPDHLDIVTRYPNDVLAHFQFSAITGLGPESAVWLFGSEGTLQFSPETETLLGGKRGEKSLAPIPIPEEERGGWRVEQEFINAIRGIEPVFRTRFEDGLRYMEFTEAVSLSLETGQKVAIPLH
jgi:predicted dehydrogenase